MSYYHYFSLKPDSYYDKLTIEEIKNKLKTSDYSFYSQGSKSILKASMVKWYYEEEVDFRKRRSEILNLLIGIQCQITHNNELEWALEAKEDEDGCIVRNRPEDEGDMQERVDGWNDLLDRIISDLLILSCIKFEADTRYSDTPKTTSDYLRYEYQNEIEETLGWFEKEVRDYEFAKFVLHNCTRQTEDEKFVENTEEDSI